MKLYLENGHVPKEKRYHDAMVDDPVAKRLFFYDSCGAYTSVSTAPPVTPTITDNQQLHLSGNVLSIDRGNSVDLTSVVGTGSGSGGGTGDLVIKEVSQNYTVLPEDDVIIAVSGGITITFESGSTARKRRIDIKNGSLTNVYFQTVNGQTVDGVTASIIIPDQSLTLVPKSNNYRIV